MNTLSIQTAFVRIRLRGIFTVTIFCAVLGGLQHAANGQILIHEQQFVGGANGWTGQSYTDVGVLTSSPSWGWISGLNWDLMGGSEGSYRHNVPFSAGAWFAWSPLITLEEGEQYYVQFGAALSSANSTNRNRAQVRVGTSTSLTAATILLPSTNIITSGAGLYNEYTSNIYTAPASGQYLFAVGDFFNADGFACYIDGIRIYKVGAAPVSLTTGAPDQMTYCAGDAVNIEYTATGSFDEGNVFTLQLSDSNGSFSSPEVIGTLQSQSSGIIAGTIPIGVFEGSGYRLRVVSSAPPLIAGDNGTDISIGLPPQVELGGDIEGCEGDIIEVYAGFPAASVVWNTGHIGDMISIIETGLYIVNVELPNGCSGSDQVFVLISEVTPSLLEASYTICIGETVMLNAGAFASIEWSNGELTNTIETGIIGEYTFEAVNIHGCITTGSTEVIYGEAPEVDLGSDQIICEEDPLTLQAPIGDYTYLWSTGSQESSIQVTTSDTYSVTVFSGAGCFSSDEVDVVVNPLPEVDLGPDIFLEEGESAILDAGPGFSDYSWNTGANTQVLQVNSAGIFSVTVTDENGCKASDEVVVSVASDIGERVFNNTMQIYPNPTVGPVRISIPSGWERSSLVIYSSQGVEVIRETVWGSFASIDLANLSSGVYLVKAIGSRGQHKEGRLIISD